uniref:Uncharacterized protein n=1 Tax=Arundo donax TaxID=35708 RepID=A0A0A9DJA6_ARUDO
MQVRVLKSTSPSTMGRLLVPSGLTHVIPKESSSVTVHEDKKRCHLFCGGKEEKNDPVGGNK